MSKYLASILPDQLMNMVTFIKDSTINVGPQPIKFAKFTQVRWDAI